MLRLPRIIRSDFLCKLIAWSSALGELTLSFAQPSKSTFDSAASKEYAAWIKPSVNPVSNCNIWGPLCQTGSIVVDINVTTTTRKVTMPCSHYLSAQSAFMEHVVLGPSKWSTYDLYTSFWRSPECTSYAKYLQAKYPPQPLFTASRSTVSIPDLTYSNCGSNSSGTLLPPEIYLPAKIDQWIGLGYPDQYCCGPCAMVIDEVKVLYFPDKSPAACSSIPGGHTTIGPKISDDIRKRAHSLLANESSIMILDGHTLTSPTFYLQIVGTARVTDGCGQVGSVYTNEIIAVPDGDLMTLSLDVPIGSHFVQADREQLFSTISSYTKPLKVADLACPTWGIAGSSGLWIYGHKGKEDTTVFVTTIGSPFHPIIIPPSNLLSFDTAWGKCSSFPDAVQLGKADGTGGNLRFEIFDPPRVLTPVAALVPTTTSASLKSALDRDLTSSISAAPADYGSPSLPVNTNGPHVKMSKPGPAASSRQASFTSGHDSAIEHIEPSPVHSEHRPSRKPSTNLGLSSQPSLTEPGHEPSNFPPANRGQDPPKESGEQPAQAPPADSNDERVQVSSESQEHQQQTNRRKLEHQGSPLSNSGKASHIVLSINHVVPHSPETGLSFDMNSAPTSKDGDDPSTRSGLAAIIYDAFGRSEFHAPSKIFHDTQDTATKTSSFVSLPTLASAVTSVADQLPSIIDSLNIGQSKLSTSGDFVMELSESVLSLSTSSDDPIIETRIPVTRAIALLPGLTSTRAADQLVAGITFSVGKSPVTISGTVFSSLASKALVIANATIRPSKSIFPQHSPFFAAGGIKTTAASGSAPIFFFNSTLNSARKAETTSVSGAPGSLGFMGVMHTSTGGNVDLPTANTSTSISGSNAMTALRGSQSKTNVPRKLMSFGGCIIFGLAKISF